LNQKLQLLYLLSMASLKVTTILFHQWLIPRDKALLITISFSKRVIDSLMLVVSTENGQRTEVSIIMTPRLSWPGSMKKINLELFLCKMDLILDKFLKDWLQLYLNLRMFLSSVMMIIWVSLLLVQPILVQLWEHLFTLSYHTYLKIKKNSKLLLINIMFKSEELMENIQKLMMEFSILVTREDLEDLWLILFKICMMVLKKWLREKWI